MRDRAEGTEILRASWAFGVMSEALVAEGRALHKRVLNFAAVAVERDVDVEVGQVTRAVECVDLLAARTEVVGKVANVP